MDQKNAEQLMQQRLDCRSRFLSEFPNGFEDARYLDEDRLRTWNAHQDFEKKLNKKNFTSLLQEGDFKSIAGEAVEIEGSSHLLVPKEQQTLKASLRSLKSAKQFATGLFQLMYGKLNVKERFDQFAETLALIPGKNSKLLTWPVQTVFGFLASPGNYIFLKPRITQAAAKAYGYNFFFEPKPNWNTYQSAYAFAHQIRHDLDDLKPRDFIDIQSFIQVIGSAKKKKK